MTPTLTTRIQEAFTQLGQYLRSFSDPELVRLVVTAQHYNGWFTPEQTEKAVKAAGDMLNEGDIGRWFEQEGLSDDSSQTESRERKTVGLVLAGNIPLVGLHDILCVLACGHTAQIKLSSQDKHLIPHLLTRLTEALPSLQQQIMYTERLQDFDAVIATGSNNTSRYFDYYFRNVPHIIRKNRNSIAVLTGRESTEELKALGHDIFDYFGLGCRNVSKLFVPEGYDFTRFFEAIEEYQPVINHHKYSNNYDYNKSVYLVNREPHLDNGFLLIRKANARTDDGLSSPLATLYYDEYRSADEIVGLVHTKSEEIQCVVAKTPVGASVQTVGFGQSQQPRLWDYADGINTIQFLRGL